MLRRIHSNTSLQIQTDAYNPDMMLSTEFAVETKGRFAEANNKRSSDSGFEDEVSSTSLSDLSLDDCKYRRCESCTPPTPTCVPYSSHNSGCNVSPIMKYSHGSSDDKSVERRPTATPFVASRQDDYLQFIEPYPVSPPGYDTLPPGGCPKFPILSPIDLVDNVLPPYTPTVYKIGVVARKTEWLSPFEPSPSRSWKRFIIELNSTQLNFYAIPGPLENHLLAFKASETRRERIFNDAEVEEMSSICSGMTSSADLQFFKFVQRLNLLSRASDDTWGNSNSTGLSNLSSKSKNKNKRLIRSYSLQHARMGLATDYKKRPNVLRVRIESEQILLNFSSIQELIDWNLAFSSGKDVSLDILEREIPRERTLPRRRRRSRSRRNSHNNSYMPGNDSTKISPNTSSESNKLKDKVLRLKSKFLSRANSVDLSKTDRNSVTSISNANLQRSRSPSLPTFNISNFSDGVDEEDNSGNLYTLNEYRGTQNDRNHDNSLREDDDEEDIQNMSDLHASDDEDDEEFDCNMEEFNDDHIDNNDNNDNNENNENNENNLNADNADNNKNNETNRERLVSMSRRYILPSSVSTSNNFKWNPAPDKSQSQRKYYRNCLRCIRPLTAENTWVNKSVVKPTTLSPISFSYLQNIKYVNSSSSSSSSLVSLGSQNMPGSSYTSTQSHRKRSLSFKESSFTLPDIALTRLPNHFLKEYVVGSHGLIPKEV